MAGGNPTYSSVTVADYNATPPADDGSAVAANLVKWSTVKTKLGDPVKTALESVNTNVSTSITAIRQLYSITETKSADFSVAVATDDGKEFLCSGTTTATLPTAASAGAGFRVSFIKTDAAGTSVTIDGNGAETVNGATTYVLSSQYATVTAFCTGSAWLLVTEKPQDLSTAATPTFTSQILAQGALDTAIVQYRSTDVATGMTAADPVVDTSTYYAVTKAVANSGGARIIGLSEATEAASLVGLATTDETTKTAAGSAHITLRAATKSGTGTASPGANANLVAIVDFQTGNAKFLFDFEGDAFADGSTFTIYDDHHDIAVIDDLRSELHMQRSERLPDFARMKRLADKKLMGYVTPERWAAGERPLWCVTKVIQLLLSNEIQSSEREIQSSERESVLWEALEQVHPGILAKAALIAEGRNVGSLPVRIK